MKQLTGILAAGLLIATLAACSNDSPQQVTLTVFAAASLKGTFTQIGTQFEADNARVTVKFNFAGSSDLVAQLQQGAPADVFASADTKNMDRATGDDLVEGTPANFATNTLEIATPPDNPAKIMTLADLAKTGTKVVVCAAEVPCGAAALGVEKAAGIDIKPVSEEQSVTDVLGKVSSGEADAGLVYFTDVRSAGASVKGIAFAESAGVVNSYPIAALKGSEHADLAGKFADYVAGAKGQAVLAAAGFAKP